ncbi:MAG: thiolase family protein, partial [Aliifodinibius sp.]|nr:thiolase family protein [Fodinibius sp.]NIY30177.1 thiolase family protein [Fodinibius sp.]
MATLLVTTSAKARELSPQPKIDIQLVSKAELRTLPSLMPEAPALTVQKLLQESELTMND